jgi:protein-L-isoaspartate O-methyltransferase
MPGLIVQMLRHTHIGDNTDVLDVGTGSGYGCAVLAHRLGSRHVTSVDVDAHLSTVAVERLASIGLHPQVITCGATGPLRVAMTGSCPRWRSGRSR